MTTYVLLLTGGALPDDAGKQPPDPHPNDIELALQRAGMAGALGPLDALLARRAAAAGFGVGYHQAAQLFRVVTAFVVDGQPEADQFAAALSREVDPVAILPARSALAEALNCYQHARDAADSHVPEVEIADDEGDKETA